MKISIDKWYGFQLNFGMVFNRYIQFGRLYYHLNKKYSYKNNDGSIVEFFARVIGVDKNCIHFPYMASVLADLKYENRKYRTATIIALVALGISLVSLSIALF